MFGGTKTLAQTDEVICVRTPRTPEQERAYLEDLDRHRGQWVAVEDFRVVAAAPSLGELRKLIHSHPYAMVIEVGDSPRGETLILGVV